MDDFHKRANPGEKDGGRSGFGQEIHQVKRGFRNGAAIAGNFAELPATYVKTLTGKNPSQAAGCQEFLRNLRRRGKPAGAGNYAHFRKRATDMRNSAVYEIPALLDTILSDHVAGYSPLALVEALPR